MPPVGDGGRCCGAEQGFLAGFHGKFFVKLIHNIQHVMVFNQQAQRQVLPGQIGGVLQNLVGVNFVNHIGNQNDE